MAAPAIPALAAMIGVLVGSPASTGAASGGGLRAQSFDTDPTCSPATPANAPCWEGRHNRLLSGSCPTTDERFGYSATTHASSVPGEIGGRLWASYTRAYYGRVLPRARTLAHPLSASGTLWIQAGAALWAGREDRGKGLGQGAPTFGFFNSDRKVSPSAGRLIRSCGRFGPATAGCTSPRFKSKSTE